MGMCLQGSGWGYPPGAIKLHYIRADESICGYHKLKGFWVPVETLRDPEQGSRLYCKRCTRIWHEERGG